MFNEGRSVAVSTDRIIGSLEDGERKTGPESKMGEAEVTVEDRKKDQTTFQENSHQLKEVTSLIFPKSLDSSPKNE